MSRRPLPAVPLLSLLIPSGPARAELPLPVYPDCGQGGACPNDLGAGDWMLRATYPPGQQMAQLDEEEVPLGPGMWLDHAFSRSTGRTDVIIANFDSGIDWDAGELRNKFLLHEGELPPPAGYPQDASGSHRGRYDWNGDGIFNMADWAEDPRILPDLLLSPNGENGSVKDPSDLIAFFSDGVDDDGNGYADDICGWDFYWNDNNAGDDIHAGGYSHGTGEGKLSTAEGGDGGAIGTCPNCMFLPVRAGDGFVVDSNNLAAAMLYAVDRGADVLQDATGAMNRTPLADAALDYAYAQGVIHIGSAADETAWHANQVAVHPRTVFVHALRNDRPQVESATTFLSFSNCTNYGPRLDLSVTGDRCSSTAVGHASGIAGLVISAGRDAVDAGTLDSPLTANEIYQVLMRAVDDVDRNPDDIIEGQYPSYEGWDPWFGYGRLNAFRAVDAVVRGEIPPEADITGPDWLAVYSLADTPSVRLSGSAAATRTDGDYTWVLEAAGGLDPRPGDWVAVESGGGNAASAIEIDLDLASLPADPNPEMRDWSPVETNVTKAREVHKHLVNLRLRVTDGAGRWGEARRAIFVMRDPDLLPGFPMRLAGSIETSPKLADVDGDGVDEVVVITSDGAVHALRGDGTELPGWPFRFGLREEVDPNHPRQHLDQPAWDTIGTDFRHGALSTPAIGDLDGDGSVEVVAASLDGELFVIARDGVAKTGWPFVLSGEVIEPMSSEDNVYDLGFFSSPALFDLDGDGDLEIAIGGMDARVYAFQHDGTDLAGWPIELRHEYDYFGELVSNGARIISSPAVGDVDGDGFPEIAIGTNQTQGGTYGLGYLLSHDGQIEPGWPIAAFGAYTNALPFVGEGIPGSPAICDIDGNGTMEVAMHTIADTGRIFGSDGSVWARLDSIAAKFGPDTNTAERASSVIMFSSGSFADLDGDAVPEYVIGATGFEYAAGLLDDGRRHDHDHHLSAWSGVSYTENDQQRLGYLPAFPRVLEDLQFFVNPAIADLDGDGAPEAIAGSGGSLLHAFDKDGAEPAGWPKDVAGWVLSSAAVGDADDDGYLDVWAGTRSGYLFGYRTMSPADTATRGWPSFHHDPRNTGNCETELRSYHGPAPMPPPDPEPACAGCESEGGAAAIVLLAPALLRRRRR